MSFCQDASHPVEPELLGPAYPIPCLLPFYPSSFLPSCSSLVHLEALGSVKTSGGRGGFMRRWTVWWLGLYRN